MSRRMRRVEYLKQIREMRSAHKLLVGKPAAKLQLRRLTLRWEGNIKMDCKAIGREDADVIHLIRSTVQWRPLVSTVINLPSGSI
jgi:hypothetical protein